MACAYETCSLCYFNFAIHGQWALVWLSNLYDVCPAMQHALSEVVQRSRGPEVEGQACQHGRLGGERGKGKKEGSRGSVKFIQSLPFAWQYMLLQAMWCVELRYEQRQRQGEQKATALTLCR